MEVHIIRVLHTQKAMQSMVAKTRKWYDLPLLAFFEHFLSIGVNNSINLTHIALCWLNTLNVTILVYILYFAISTLTTFYIFCWTVRINLWIFTGFRTSTSFCSIGHISWTTGLFFYDQNFNVSHFLYLSSFPLTFLKIFQIFGRPVRMGVR